MCDDLPWIIPSHVYFARLGSSQDKGVLRVQYMGGCNLFSACEYRVVQ